MNLELKKRQPNLFTNWLSPDTLFDVDLFDRLPDLYPANRMNIPSVNIKETPKSFELDLAAPGLKRDDFNLEIDDNLLSISSEKEEEKESKNGYTRKEFSYSSFLRTFRLPDNVNFNKIEAKYENGMLKVVIPKLKETPAKKAKHIQVA